MRTTARARSRRCELGRRLVSFREPVSRWPLLLVDGHVTRPIEGDESTAAMTPTDCCQMDVARRPWNPHECWGRPRNELATRIVLNKVGYQESIDADTAGQELGASSILTTKQSSFLAPSRDLIA